MKYIFALIFYSCFNFLTSFGQGITATVTHFKLRNDTITFTYTLKNNSKLPFAIDNIHKRINVYEQSDLKFKPHRPVNYIYLSNSKHKFPKSNPEAIGKWPEATPTIMNDDGTIHQPGYMYLPVELTHILNIKRISTNTCGRYFLINSGETVELKIMSYLGCYLIEAGNMNFSMNYLLAKKNPKVLIDFQAKQKRNKRLKAYSLYDETITSNVIKFKYSPINSNADSIVNKMYRRIPNPY